MCSPGKIFLLNQTCKYQKLVFAMELIFSIQNLKRHFVEGVWVMSTSGLVDKCKSYLQALIGLWLKVVCFLFYNVLLNVNVMYLQNEKTLSHTHTPTDSIKMTNQPTKDIGPKNQRWSGGNKMCRNWPKSPEETKGKSNDGVDSLETLSRRTPAIL